jgi:hypothetical protein
VITCDRENEAGEGDATDASLHVVSKTVLFAHCLPIYRTCTVLDEVIFFPVPFLSTATRVCVGAVPLRSPIEGTPFEASVTVGIDDAAAVGAAETVFDFSMSTTQITFCEELLPEDERSKKSLIGPVSTNRDPVLVQAIEFQSLVFTCSESTETP